MVASRFGKRKTAVFTLLSAVLTLLVYLPSLQNQFVNWDDWMYVYENPNIRSLDFGYLKRAFTSVYAANWHPLTMLSLALDYQVLGFNPFQYHLSNIMLHSINTTLVFVLTLMLIKAERDGNDISSLNMTGAYTASILTALLFGLHPLHVESVSWVSERKDVLSGLFFLLSVIFYVSYAGPSRKGYGYLLSLLSFVLALMSKPMAVTLPLVLLLIDYYPLRRFGSGSHFKKAVAEKLPFFVLSVASSAITIWAQSAGGALREFESYSLSSRILNAGWAYIFYLKKMIFPAGLAPLYPYNKNISLLDTDYAIPLLLVFFLTAFSIAGFKRHKLISSVWLYYVITLLPVIGLIQVGGQAAADRYTYLPSIGPFMFIAAVIGSIIDRMERRFLPFAFIGMALLFYPLASANISQQSVWKDSVTLWTHEIALYPGKTAVAYYNRGLAYQKKGELKTAIADFDRAIEMNPAYIQPHINRGLAYSDSGDLDSAIKDFDRALELNRKYAKAYLNRGFVYLKKGEYGKAKEDLKMVIALEPKNAFAYYNLGLASEKLGYNEEGRVYLKRSSELGYKAAEDHLKDLAGTT